MPIRLLLVEDDPVSQSFLRDALSGLPATVDTADDIASALTLAGQFRHDLWLVDAHLPDGDGIGCLRAMRKLHDTPALAITAGAPREELDQLCSSGFLEVLLKPVSIALLQGTVRRLLGFSSATTAKPGSGKLPVWDEHRALAAIGGNVASLAKLRKLFLDELPAMEAGLRIAQADGDMRRVGALLHKLKASCGFVGAARLARAVDALARSPLDTALLDAFGHDARDALDSGAPQ